MSYDFTNIKNKLQAIQTRLEDEYKQISTGRANPSLLDSIFVDSYGSKQPIKNIASINIEDPRTLRISPWDKNQVGAIEQAIRDSSLPVSVSSSEAGVRVAIPQLTTESKDGLIKIIKEKLEDARVAIREERRVGMDDIEKREKAGEFAEDDRKRHQADLQKMVDELNMKLDELLARKEKDIMSV